MLAFHNVRPDVTAVPFTLDKRTLSYKYVLEWMGHSSSAILDMYFTMNDRYAQTAMNSLSFNSGKVENKTVFGPSGTKFCETLPQPTHLKAVTKPLEKLTERAGFDLPSLCKVLNNLILQLNSNDSKDLNSLVDLLFLYDFLLSRDVF
jgi:hypothetical protein